MSTEDQAGDRPIRREPTITEACEHGEWADFCRCCASERRTARELAENGPRLSVVEAQAMAREGIRKATHTEETT